MLKGAQGPAGPTGPAAPSGGRGAGVSVGSGVNLPVLGNIFTRMFGAPDLGRGNPTPALGEKVVTVNPNSWDSGMGAGGPGTHDAGN